MNELSKLLVCTNQSYLRIIKFAIMGQKMTNRDIDSIPAIMYHSIGIRNEKWQWNYLTLHHKLFETYLKWMKATGFHSISLEELYAFLTKGKKLAKNPVVLTFDDGYVDNWVFAYPLLKKYGFKGTIFVSPEFVDSRNVTRKNLEHVCSGEVGVNDLETTGYLSWKEMREMEEEEIIDVQSHTMTHTWYPSNNIIIDFRHPGDSYIWMTWNDNPEKKPYLQFDNEELVGYGEPVYQHGRAIGIRRFFPDENLKMHLTDYVKEKNTIFFISMHWKEKLLEIAQKYKVQNQLDEKFETQEEYEKRVYYELRQSKKIIEDSLNKEVKFLAWPGGAMTDRALEIASGLGYVLSTYPSREIRTATTQMKKESVDLARLKRIGSALYWNEKRVIYFPPPLFVLKMKLLNVKKKYNQILLNLEHFVKKRSRARLFEKSNEGH